MTEYIEALVVGYAVMLALAAISIFVTAVVKNKASFYIILSTVAAIFIGLPVVGYGVISLMSFITSYN